MNYSRVDLSPYTTFHVEATASRLSVIESETSLLKAINSDSLNKFVLGGGSNVLFTKHLHAHVLLNRIHYIKPIHETKKHVDIAVGAGVEWHQFVLWTLENGYSGLENLSLIPGMVGAAPIQNIGAYGVEQKDAFLYLEAIDLLNGQKHRFTNKDCRFGYRESIFKSEARLKFCITQVVYRLQKAFHPNVSYGAIQEALDAKGINKPTAKDLSDVVISIRKSKLPDPQILGNAGSFFKNPLVSRSHYKDLLSSYPKMPSYPVDDDWVKVPAGWLIEHCGWKGKRIGDVGCFEKQALVIVNYGDAEGSKIKQHALNIKKSVYKRFNINLQNEVNIF